jgi:dimethylglycine dehydrogenase
MRVNFVGELGWELHHPLTYQNHIWDRIMDAGRGFDIKPFGVRAMDSLRVEKSYKYWRVDLTTEYSAWQAGLDRFIRLDKGDFPGRSALLAERQQGVPRKLVTLACAVRNADPFGNEPIWAGHAMIGRATSGAYGYTVGKSLALAYVDAKHTAPGTKLKIEILGRRYPCTVIPDSPWDPDNARLRG